MAEPIIEIVDVHKSFGAQKVLDGVNLSIGRGETTVIIGRSGGGKSTLLRLLIGLSRPDRGKILVEGEDITRLKGKALARIRKKFGMLFQYAALFDSMSVFDNVAFPLVEHTRMSRGEIEEMVAEILRQVGLPGTEKKFPSELSGGMRKRVGLARAIILKPKIILYDEPTSGLDPLMAAAIDTLIERLQKEQGLTNCVISHDIPAAFRVGQQIAMLYRGRIIAKGTPEELKTIDNPYVQQFIQGSSEGPIDITEY